MGDWHYHIKRTLIQTPITDVYTRIFDPCMASLNRWGLDELLLSDPRLAVETCRVQRWNLAEFRHLAPGHQGEHIWNTLFIHTTPISQPTRAVLSVLTALNLNPKERNIHQLRAGFPEDLLEQVLGISGAARVVMSNDPFSDKERALWQAQPRRDYRFYSSLNLDGLVNEWPQNWSRLKPWGYKVTADGNQVEDINRFLETWVDRTNPLYCSCNLRSDFVPHSENQRLFRKYVLPLCERRSLALGLFATLPYHVALVEELCQENPGLRFLVQFSDPELQGQLLEKAGRFTNLLPLNPLGPLPLERFCSSSLVYASGAYILEQMAGGWTAFKSNLVEQLAQTYQALEVTGYQVEPEQIERDLRDLLGENFWRFLGR